MSATRVIGLGQPAAGDDGVGLAVLDALRRRGVAPDVELRHAAEDTDLIELVATPHAVVLVDAVLGTPAGAVVELTPAQLATRARGVSTHGIGVTNALALARTLAPDVVPASLRIVAVTIERPTVPTAGLSPAVAAAVPPAVACVLRMLGEPDPASATAGTGLSGSMHEASLAGHLLAAVLERATAAGATRVRVVRGWVAESEALSADSLAFHFAAHARGTIADGARIDLRLIHVQARCRACDAVYAPDHHLTLCPACGSVDGELLGRTGMGIDTLEIEP